MSKKTAKELRRLIDAALAGELTEEEQRQLERQLVEDDDALRTYLDHCQLETDLFFHVRATLAGRRFRADLRLDEPPQKDAELSPVGAQARRPALAAFTGSLRKSRLRALSAVAATLCVGLFAWWAIYSFYWEPISAERQPQIVARLTDAGDAQWLDTPPPVGHSFVERDSIYLKSGTARISMASGAEMVLRGPCLVTLAAPDRVELEEGVVTAQVAEWGRGFTVSTDWMQIVDLGTKFAVSAKSGVAEAHVLDGQVRIQPLSAAVSDRRSLLLSSGEAIRVEGEKPATRLAADRGQFDAEMGSLAPYKPIRIFNTGSGLVAGDEDPHWRVIAGPKCEQFSGPEFAVVCDADRRYLANDPARSQWISICNPVRPGVPPSSQFTFQTTFDLTGYDLSTVTAAAQVIADNGIRAVRINGQPVPLAAWTLNEKLQYFNKFHVVEIKEGFVAGMNKVEFDVWNGVDRYDPNLPNPMSLRVEWQAFGRPLPTVVNVAGNGILLNQLATQAELFPNTVIKTGGSGAAAR